MVDEDGEPLYPTNCSMPSSINHPKMMALYHDVDLFYDTLVVCSYSKYKGLKENPQCVILPKVHDLIPPTVVMNPVG